MMSLRAFEATARHLTFAEAARECGLTQGAISRQVRLLEQNLGQDMFERTHSRLALTSPGREFLEGIRPALDRIEAATIRIAGHRGVRDELHVATLPAFGAHWLVPRLASFTAAHPNVEIRIYTRIEPVDLEQERLDAAIHFGRAPPAGAIGDWIFDEDPLPVCSPAIRHREGLPMAEAIASYRLLHPLHRSFAWADWMAGAGLSAVEVSSGPVFEQLQHSIEAARSGLGLVLAPRFIVEHDLRTGALVSPFAIKVRSGWGYWLVYPRGRRAGRSFELFRRWIMGQID